MVAFARRSDGRRRSPSKGSCARSGSRVNRVPRGWHDHRSGLIGTPMRCCAAPRRHTTADGCGGCTIARQERSPAVCTVPIRVGTELPDGLRRSVSVRDRPALVADYPAIDRDVGVVELMRTGRLDHELDSVHAQIRLHFSVPRSQLEGVQPRPGATRQHHLLGRRAGGSLVVFREGARESRATSALRGHSHRVLARRQGGVPPEPARHAGIHGVGRAPDGRRPPDPRLHDRVQASV